VWVLKISMASASTEGTAVTARYTWFIATVTHVFCCTAFDYLVVHAQCMGTHSRNLHIMHSLHARNVTYLNMGSLLRFCPSFSFFILSLFETISKQSAARWTMPTVIISGERNRKFIAWKDSNIVALKGRISHNLNPEFSGAKRKAGDMTGS
jgi:hypothetical protein